MKKRRKSASSHRPDDAPLSRLEMKTARPLYKDFPDLASYSRQRARQGEAKKQAVSLRLSSHVLDYFKSRGSGWQTRINDALAAFVSVAE